MARVSLVEAYDNKSVIRQIFWLKAHKQNKLTAGEGITIVDDVISATMAGGQHVYVGIGEPPATLGNDRDIYFEKVV